VETSRPVVIGLGCLSAAGSKEKWARFITWLRHGATGQDGLETEKAGWFIKMKDLTPRITEENSRC
jgi:hypothetical protein